MNGHKEAIYDAQIAPLIHRVIIICKEAGIPVVAAFALDDDLGCTTYIVPERVAWPMDDEPAMESFVTRFAPATRDIGNPVSPLNLVVRDASGTIKSMETIL